MINVSFFGTHHFAVHILQGLIDNPDINVQQVITQPDRPVGRKKVLTPPPVKVLAKQYNLQIDQPEVSAEIKIIPSIDIAITAQYGNIIPKNILDAPKHGMLNIHTSLLPKYRGASPIQSAILNGDKITGVTIMKMDAGLDTGPILLQKSIAIDPDDTAPIVEEKLATLANVLLPQALSNYLAGTISPIDQQDDLATHTKKLSKEDGRIDWTHTTQMIYNQYRALLPWPGIWTTHNDERIKILNCTPAPEIKNTLPGKVHIQNNHLYVGTKNSAIEILILQPAGKQPLKAAQYIQGYATNNASKTVFQ